ncbi:MAG: CRISPR-associated endonuclease Cas2 [Spirochaetes bacterium]|nr:CRISPR-associated endonuclease Cas2 [Spirochaetota bacterium]
MLVLVTYDVSTVDSRGARRLRKIAKVCINYGIRVQKSVFECNVSPAQWEVLKSELLKCFKKDEDSLRFYLLGSKWKRRIEHHGVVGNVYHDEPMII